MLFDYLVLPEIRGWKFRIVEQLLHDRYAPFRHLCNIRDCVKAYPAGNANPFHVIFILKYHHDLPFFCDHGPIIAAVSIPVNDASFEKPILDKFRQWVI